MSEVIFHFSNNQLKFEFSPKFVKKELALTQNFKLNSEKKIVLYTEVERKFTLKIIVIHTKNVSVILNLS